MDVVYVVGGSAADHVELRYSLRSVVKYLRDVGGIWIYGELPWWARTDSGLRHARIPDLFDSPHANACLKAHLAANCPEISDPFLFMNDDFYICREMGAGDVRLLHEGELKSASARREGGHRRAMWNTLATLQREMPDRPLWSFELHCPMPVFKSSFLAALRRVGWAGQTEDDAVLWRSVYGNLSRRQSWLEKDLKFRDESLASMRETVQGTWCFSVEENMSEAAKMLIEEMYPDPSPWEVAPDGI